MSQSVAFIGLGAMGYRMAAHLPKHFEEVYVWNRNFSKAEQHATEYGTTAVELSEAVQADIIFSCLPTSQDVETLILQIHQQNMQPKATDFDWILSQLKAWLHADLDAGKFQDYSLQCIDLACYQEVLSSLN